MPTGRIQKALSGFYYVNDNGKLYQTRARGVFRKQKVTPLVGDIVDYESETEKEGTIWAIHPRKNELQRPAVANVDLGFVIMSIVEPDFSFQLLEQFLLYLEYHHIAPVIVITKTDLVEAKIVLQLQHEMAYYEAMGYPVFYSNKASWPEDDLQAIESLVAGKLAVFMGQSGAGKSTLMNILSPGLTLATAEISQTLGRGKHTTRHVELLDIFSGLIADTPGFSSLSLDEIEPVELPKLYPDFEALATDCKFRVCMHRQEPKCAVKAFVAKKRIPQRRYDNYLNILERLENKTVRY